MALNFGGIVQAAKKMLAEEEARRVAAEAKALVRACVRACVRASKRSHGVALCGETRLGD